MTDPTLPAHAALATGGTLAARAAAARASLSRCDLCPRRCGADRTDPAARPLCGVGARAIVGWWGLGEGERCLGAPLGSIVFAGCSMRCMYCSTAEVSIEGEGQTMDDDALAGILLSLQAQGVAAVELVGPSHVAPHVLSALTLAASRGFASRLIWNSGGYDALTALRLMDGVVDLYLPDLKYAEPHPGRAYSRVPDYVPVSRAALTEMRRQVGDLELDAHGLARRGLLVRHLVLPGGLGGGAEGFAWLAATLSPRTAVSVRGDYQPAFRAAQYPPLDRPPEAAEIAAARAAVTAAGLRLVE